MNNVNILRYCLKASFAAACAYGDNVQNKPDVYAVSGNPFVYNFDIIQKMISRFWTDDFLDDMVVNEGSGVYVRHDFLMDLSRRFWAMLTFEVYGGMLTSDIANRTTVTEGIFPRADIIEMTGEMLKAEIGSCQSNVLFSSEVRDHYKPCAGLKDIDITEFLNHHDWLIPFFLVFVLGIYDEVRQEITSTQAVG